MPRRRQADNIKLIIKGKPSPDALPVEIGLSLPCMKEIRERIGGSVKSIEGRLVWVPDAKRKT